MAEPIRTSGSSLAAMRWKRRALRSTRRVPTGDRRGSLLPGLGEAAVAAASDRVVGAGAAGATDPDATFEDQYEARANDWRATMIEKVSSARAVGVRV